MAPAKKTEWQKNADFWIKIIRNNLDPFRSLVTNKAVLDPFSKEKGQKILDAGCGEGYLCRKLAKRGQQMFGLDFNLQLIKAAKQLETEKPLGIKYFVADIRKTGFPASFFDGIISHQTIHEIENPEKALREFYRLLKSGGKLIVLFLHPCFDFGSEEVKNTPLSVMYFQKTKIKKCFYLVGGIKSPSSYFYLHLFLSQWFNLFTKAGFQIAKIEEPHPPLKFIKQNSWWKNSFNKPRLILFEAFKR
ncbi:MAG: hypothetical protein COT34_02435 [Candidatus Nealsonbacteria bacterium CG08_land_8_20_14_0_20_43_11]|uniref:Methyltransferase type 11 domain-containing protein n=1 Tax=Candidatus Nealsonbacteria bacterium CG08_land_8_20_14_0_20_43_11 TaxID=1974706 RepID=A0A2M6T0F9_9BACT|nr:MAG: hypothetical protein COT34_02435 [Candidatus Nealsonbacteria bacterium CG08_land_8_20_14_0_20_43_11]